MQFIPMKIAASRFGFSSVKALDRWIRRHNARNRSLIVRKRRGAVVEEDLERAIMAEVEAMTPGLQPPPPKPTTSLRRAAKPQGNGPGTPVTS